MAPPQAESKAGPHRRVTSAAHRVGKTQSEQMSSGLPLRADIAGVLRKRATGDI